MKIGEFAAVNQTSIDTIRHYMALQLISPEKKGGQFYFDAICQKNFNEIRLLKDLGFSLKEISRIMNYKRLGQLTDYQIGGSYLSIFKQKSEAIRRDVDRLEAQHKQLEAFIANIPVTEVSATALGFPMEALSLVACHKCKGAMVLNAGQIVKGHILFGDMSCQCGQGLTINDGILYGEGALDIKEDTYFRPTFIDDYLETTDPAYINKLYQGLEWSQRHVNFENDGSGVALELGTGHGFFMRHFIHQLPDNCLYIAVDHNPQALIWLKRTLEKQTPKAKLLFLCSDFNALPLQDKTVDFVLDISGSSNYGFNHEVFLLKVVSPLFKEHCILHGYYILFKKFALHSKIGLQNRMQFIQSSIEDEIKKLGFTTLDFLETEPIKEGGPMEDYFVEGELVSSLVYYGKR